MDRHASRGVTPIDLLLVAGFVESVYRRALEVRDLPKEGAIVDAVAVDDVGGDSDDVERQTFARKQGQTRSKIPVAADLPVQDRREVQSVDDGAALARILVDDEERAVLAVGRGAGLPYFRRRCGGSQSLLQAACRRPRPVDPEPVPRALDDPGGIGAQRRQAPAAAQDKGLPHCGRVSAGQAAEMLGNAGPRIRYGLDRHEPVVPLHGLSRKGEIGHGQTRSHRSIRHTGSRQG